MLCVSVAIYPSVCLQEVSAYLRLQLTVMPVCVWLRHKCLLQMMAYYILELSAIVLNSKLWYPRLLFNLNIIFTVTIANLRGNFKCRPGCLNMHHRPGTTAYIILTFNWFLVVMRGWWCGVDLENYTICRVKLLFTCLKYTCSLTSFISLTKDNIICICKDG